MPNERIGIPDAVRALRSELTATIKENEHEELRFDLRWVEIELTLAIEHQTEAQAGVNVWVVSVGGKGSMTSASTHNVTLSMAPYLQDLLGESVEPPPTATSSAEGTRSVDGGGGSAGSASDAFGRSRVYLDKRRD